MRRGVERLSIRVPRALVFLSILSGCARGGGSAVDSGAWTRPPSPWDTCAALPKSFADFDAVEARLLAGEITEHKFDPQGCRVLRRVDAGSGVYRQSFELVRGTVWRKQSDGTEVPTPDAFVLYAREIAGSTTREQFDNDGDGALDVERTVRLGPDGGEASSEYVTRRDGGATRTRESFHTAAMNHVVREVWADGGWQVVQEGNEWRREGLRVEPIRRGSP